ncbi:hypothetical protein CRUP_038740 [Coryphaenoides rupestris]|nr:hypothetical protein CRUP_038740 [Coryphaenoides rupestris]
MKKSAAQSMLDVALLMANSSQLKTLMHVGARYRFYIPMLVLLSLSITLQVAVGLLLVFIGNGDTGDAGVGTQVTWERGHRWRWSGDTGDVGAGTQVTLERGHR